MSTDSITPSEVTARLAETILILCDVPIAEVKSLAFEWYTDRHLWDKMTLEQWLNQKGFKSRPFAFIPQPIQIKEADDGY